MDAQGAEKARPYVERAGVTFSTLVDRQNSVGELYGFPIVATGISIDEEGTVFYHFGGGCEIRREATEEMVRACLEERKPAQQPPAYQNVGPQEEAARLFRKRTAFYEEKRIQKALALWRRAWALDQQNWAIRKQVWTVENPVRFYEGPVDYPWQREQVEKGR